MDNASYPVQVPLDSWISGKKQQNSTFGWFGFSGKISIAILVEIYCSEPAQQTGDGEIMAENGSIISLREKNAHEKFGLGNFPLLNA